MASSNPVYTLNAWLWSHAELVELFDPDDASYSPFFPVQVFPQEEDTFVRYSFLRQPGFHWLQQKMRVMYGVYSNDIDKLHAIEEYISDVSRSEYSVTRLQNWYDEQRRAAGEQPEWLFHDLRFNVGADLPAPDQDSADFGRLLTLEFDYSQCKYTI